MVIIIVIVLDMSSFLWNRPQFQSKELLVTLIYSIATLHHRAHLVWQVSSMQGPVLHKTLGVLLPQQPA